MPETWHDFRALLRNPREGSALHKALDPEWDIKPDLMFLRDITWMLQRFWWARYDQRPNAFPEPTLLTEAERQAKRDAKKVGSADLMSPEEAMARLGLAPRREEVPDGR